MIESDARRLAFFRKAGETFTTGRPEKLRLIFDREFLEQQLGDFAVEDYGPKALGRSSDVALHELRKQDVLTRDVDGKQYSVERLEPDGQGMTLIVFNE